MLRIRAFMAPDDPISGEGFVLGHQKVLSEIGVKVTSGGNEWINDPFVCVMVVEDMDSNNEIVGGARLHIAHRGSYLPMVEAISKVDDRIYGEIDDLIDNGVAEVCGLWNGRSIAGLGIGSNLLVRTCIALSTQLNLDKLVALVAKHTYKRAVQKGFRTIETVGDRGEFNYPKLNLIATAIVLDDAVEIPTAIDVERNEILGIRNNPTSTKTEKWAKGEYEVEFNILLDTKETDIK